MCKRKKYYEGYMTVEATFVVPLALMIIVLLLYWGFYCYDKSVSIQCSYLAALRGSNEWDLSDGEMEQMVERQLEELLEDTILYTKPKQKDISVGLWDIEAGVKGEMDVLFSEIRGDEMDRWEMESKKSAARLKPTSFIRKYHFIGE